MSLWDRVRLPGHLDIGWLKANCDKIHYFGLGFIQIKVTDEYRLHFYVDSLPAIVGAEEIHNHRRNFYSRILGGKFEQTFYELAPGDTHLVDDESCRQGVENQWVDPVPCSILDKSRHTYAQGSEYYVSHDVFHSVNSPEGAITLIKQSPLIKNYAKVVRRAGAPKICPFSRKIDEVTLWELVCRSIEVHS